MSKKDVLQFVSSDFDVFTRKAVQDAVQETDVVIYKPIVPIDQSDLEFLIPTDFDTYVDPDIKLYVRGKFTKADGTDLNETDHTVGTNNFLHSLLIQCTIALNGVDITQSGVLYNYRAYLETISSYGNDAASSHLTNSYWHKDAGDMPPCNPTKADSTNTGFIERWKKQKQSKKFEMYGRIHSDPCNVPKFLLPGVSLQIKFKNAKPSFYLMNTKADSTTIFKFIDAKLYVRRIKAHPSILLAHDDTLKTDLAYCDLTTVTLKTFTFSSGVSSLSIDQAVTDHLPKRLLFAMVDNSDFLGAITTTSTDFRISVSLHTRCL